MKDKTVLRLITGVGICGWTIMFRKGPTKDWFLVYLFKTIITTLIDGPVVKKRLVTYPYRYIPKLFDTNIIFDYVIFPLLCVLYSQYTSKLKPLRSVLSVVLFSVPMTLIQEWLERKTRLVKYSRQWNWFNTFSVLTFTFWASRGFMALVGTLHQSQNKASAAPKTAEHAAAANDHRLTGNSPVKTGVQSGI